MQSLARRGSPFRLPQQPRQRRLWHRRHLDQRQHRGIPLAPLDSTDVRPMDLAFEPEVLLRQAELLPLLADGMPEGDGRQTRRWRLLARLRSR